ncbi:hypothetical protein FBZ89_109200 [Nitrospirillum amazonense]|uniref:Uncharacterized protein n=1 Tax=Nitrospirillum amazonense TaxID=28077 RepID=A0A560FB28_9PROT|nr:hypothetical protein [Nitrospirillum amazonense]TWB18814.1 hypothetical protein FBZ89_109200 [Nitrospirillum amazonense]
MRLRLLRLLLILTCVPGVPPGRAADLPINQQPLYGGVEKTEKQKQADAKFIASIEALGVTHEEGARRVVLNAWRYLASGNLVAAMTRFNQAWMLDPQSGEPYHGFAVVLAMRNAPAAEVERYFQMALAQPRDTVSSHVDYARYLDMQHRYQESLAQSREALAASPTAHNARAQIAYVYANQNDLPQACRCAREAQANGDELEIDFLASVCSGQP